MPMSPACCFIVPCRDALRQAENGVGPLAADLASLQCQLAQLMQQPFGLPASSRASSRRSSRPTSARAMPPAAAGAAAELEPELQLSAGGEEGAPRSDGAAQWSSAVGSRHGSPRIRAVHSRAEQQAGAGQQADEGALAVEGAEHSGTAAAKDDVQPGQQQPSSHALVRYLEMVGKC